MPSLGSERAGAQDPLLRYAVEAGWAYLAPEEALRLRRGEGGTLLYSILESKLVHLNPGIVEVATAAVVVERIENQRNGIAGNAEVLAWLRGERSVLVESERRQRNVTVIDFEHAAENLFQVTEEWRYTNGTSANRADVVFLINGIPVAVAETKSARKRGGMEAALTQIRRYHRETPEMMTAPQVFDITSVLEFYYGATWSLQRQGVYNWRDEEPGNFERKVKQFFGRERFLKLLADWIVFFRKDDELQKVILRQHQTRAAERVVGRVLDPIKRRGLVWHTQGAGKTLTMMKAAELILSHPALGKPTVLMLVDRNELESQLFNNLRAYGLTPEVAESKAHLTDLLRREYRGLIVSTIHKFDRADADLCRRSNVVVLVDEAHRTTGGDLGIYLQAALPQATMLGFTGTPIDRSEYGGGTFKVFGVDDAQGYLDKYSMRESIEDGTTLKLKYCLAPNQIRVPEKLLDEEFLSLTAAEGISDIDELNRILDGAVRLKAFLKADDRVAKVAEFVARDFRERVEPLGYKAFLVGVDREACALYKQELDRHLPADYSQVVFTSPHNDPPLTAQFRLAPDEEKRVRRAFAKPGERPQILIVTEKLLTGFDAPILYCMYLDKPMRDHTLLQAIARVNRPYEDARGVRKPVGMVVDFIGIFSRLNRALAFDADEVASCVEGTDRLKERFGMLMAEQAPRYLALAAPPISDKAIERVVTEFAEKEKREAFLALFDELQELYEILSPDVFLRPYIDSYSTLGVIREIVGNAFGWRLPFARDLMHKTEALVREAVTSSGVARLGAPVIIDENTLRALKDESAAPELSVVNLVCGGLVHGAADQPHLASIAERAGQIVEALDDRQISTGEAMVRLAQVVEEFLQEKRERDATGLAPSAFRLFWMLQQAGVGAAAELAPKLDAVFDRFDDFRADARQQRELRQELYAKLPSEMDLDDMVALVDRLIEARR